MATIDTNITVNNLNLFNAEGQTILSTFNAIYTPGINLLSQSKTQLTAEQAKYLLQCLNGFILKTSPNFNLLGEVLVGQQNIYAPNIKSNNILSRSPILFQKPFVVPGTVYENIVLGLKTQDLVLDELTIFRRVQNLLNKYNLWLRYYTLFNYDIQVIKEEELDCICLIRALLVEPCMILAEKDLSHMNSQNLQILLQNNSAKYIFIFNDITTFHTNL